MTWLTMKGCSIAGFLMLVGTMAVAYSTTFYHVVEGYPLNLDDSMPEGRDTEAVKLFLSSGINLYNENPETLPASEELFNGMCSGCHGHHAEGKIGPGLNDSYWTYPDNNTDTGLFSTVFGGARGQMGPMWGALTLDEMLRVMAWVRHLYTGPADTATWLTPEKRSAFRPFVPAPKKGT